MKQKTQSSRTSLNKILSWTKCALLGGILLNGSSCEDTNKILPGPSDQYWIKKYKGGIIHDEKGYYQDSRLIARIYFSSQDNEEIKIREIANLIGADISGKNSKLSAYSFDVASSSLDGSINTLNTIHNIQAFRNYYSVFSGYDNDRYLANETSTDLNAEVMSYLSWWHRSINLTKGLDILDGKLMELTTIAVLDSGFDLSDSEIPFVETNNKTLTDITIINPDSKKSRLSWNFSEMNGDVSYYNPNYSHGHEVVQFIAGKNNTIRANGVASIGNQAFWILPLKVGIDDTPENKNSKDDAKLVDDFMVSYALSYIDDISEYTNIKVVSISFGGSKNPNLNLPLNSDILVNDAIQLLHDKGIIVVASNGNESKEACENVPSSFDNVVAVGGTGLQHQFVFGKVFSNGEKRFYWEIPGKDARGSNYSDNEKCLTIAAPAQDLLTFPSAEDKFDNQGIGVGVLGEIGTSFSSPMVAGAIALLKARAYPVLRPDSYSSVKTYLRQTAKDLVLSGEINHAELNGKIWKTLDVGNLVAYMEGKIPKIEGISEAFHLGTFDLDRPLADYGYVGDHNKVFDFNIFPNTIVPRVIKKQAEKYPELDESIIGLDNGTVAYVREVYDNMQNRTKEYFLTDLRDGKTTSIKKPDKIEPKQVLYRNGKIIWNLADGYLVTNKDGKEIYTIPTDQTIYETDGETFLFSDKIFRNGQLRNMPAEMLASKGYLFREGVALIWDDKTISRYDLDSGKVEKLVDESNPVVYDLDRDNLLYAIYRDGQATVKIFNWHTKTYARTMVFGKDSLAVPTQIRGNLLIATSRTDMNLKFDLYAYIWK